MARVTVLALGWISVVCLVILTGMASVIERSLPADPLGGLRVLADEQGEITRLRREYVIAARRAGATWQQIGDAMGMTRQSAWELFTREVRETLARTAADLDEDEAMALAVAEVKAVRRSRR